MPQVFKIGSYLVFIWYNEGVPLEPVHVHVSEGVPSENATKIWITKERKALLCHNKSKIPAHKLNIIMRMIEAQSFEILSKWQDFFGELKFYC